METTARNKGYPKPANDVRGSEVAQEGISRSLLLTMSVAAGAGIANLYYNQPLLDQMARDLNAGEGTIGLVPTLTQIGYAVGMLLLVPLGDMHPRRRLALLFSVLTALALLGTALSVSAPMLVAFSLVLGVCNMAPQLLIPFAAQLAPKEDRGKVVGFMLSGIFIGVLLSRTVAGFVGGEFGWRAMFVAAAVVMVVLTIALARMLPTNVPTYAESYARLLKSVFDLLRDHPTLREACLFGATLFAAFMIFWSSLIHLMVSSQFDLGPRAVGLYGILGAAAAVLSPVIGKLADKGAARTMAGLMIILTIASFGVFWFGRASLVWIGVGVLLMDLGVQLAHVSNQSRILHLASGAQSRIQTAYMTSYFAGGGIGAAIGAFVWDRWEWAGVCTAAVVVLLVPLIRWLLPAGEK